MWGLFWIGSIGRDRITSGWSEKGAEDDTATGLLLKSLALNQLLEQSAFGIGQGVIWVTRIPVRAGSIRQRRVVLGCRRLAGCALLEQTGDGREFPPDAVPSLVAHRLRAESSRGSSPLPRPQPARAATRAAWKRLSAPMSSASPGCVANTSDQRRAEVA